jgi:AcrR family transcriptional regulator
VSEKEIDELRSRFAREAMALMERTGQEVTRTRLAAELKIARARLDVVFPEEGDLLEAVTGEWFAPKLAVMDEVMASDLPPRRKMYEFFARRFRLLRQNFREDPATFNLYVEMGERYFDYARSYIDLADHYLCELIAEAQADGYLQGLEVDTAMSLINQMVGCYLQPYMIAMIDDRLSEEKLALIVGAIFDGLDAKDGGARGTQDIRAA